MSLAAGLAACAKAGESGASREGGFAIGLLFPDIQVTRYETFDRPLIEKIEKKVKQLYPEREDPRSPRPAPTCHRFHQVVTRAFLPDLRTGRFRPGLRQTRGFAHS